MTHLRIPFFEAHSRDDGEPVTIVAESVIAIAQINEDTVRATLVSTNAGVFELLDPYEDVCRMLQVCYDSGVMPADPLHWPTASGAIAPVDIRRPRPQSDHG